MQSLSSHKELLRFFIGDVRDKDRLCRAFGCADVVIHSAVLKNDLFLVAISLSSIMSMTKLHNKCVMMKSNFSCLGKNGLNGYCLKRGEFSLNESIAEKRGQNE